MRLLICTQKVDLDDPVLGFFHRWIVEFAKRCETVHVICLSEGRHELPRNVVVHSLGKENGRSRIKYISNFYRYAWRYRRNYDAVFVHMNEEYALLGGRIWRALGKRVVLWRNHKLGSGKTRAAARLAHTVCYTSPDAFVAPLPNAVKMPAGIDTDFFSPAGTPKPDTILFLGRLDPVKRVELFIKALESLHDHDIRFTTDIVGDPSESLSKYAHDVRNLASTLALEGVLAMHPAVTNDMARDFYRSHSVYCNLTPAGSLDKTILEAMASGAIAVACNDAVRDALPAGCFIESDAPEETARSLATALALNSLERKDRTETSRSYVVREHSLVLLVERLMPILSI